MSRRRQTLSFAILLIVIVWAILPWLIPAYSQNLTMTVRFLNNKTPSYEVSLKNAAPWPIELTDAQWFVEHNSRYSFWVPSEAPRQELWLLPYQSHTFQFAIYNECHKGPQYYNGPLTVQLRATIHVIGATSQISFPGAYNSTFPVVPSSKSTALMPELNC